MTMLLESILKPPPVELFGLTLLLALKFVLTMDVFSLRETVWSMLEYLTSLRGCPEDFA